MWEILPVTFFFSSLLFHPTVHGARGQHWMVTGMVTPSKWCLLALSPIPGGPSPLQTGQVLPAPPPHSSGLQAGGFSPFQHLFPPWNCALDPTGHAANMSHLHPRESSTGTNRYKSVILAYCKANLSKQWRKPPYRSQCLIWNVAFLSLKNKLCHLLTTLKQIRSLRDIWKKETELYSRSPMCALAAFFTTFPFP